MVLRSIFDKCVKRRFVHFESNYQLFTKHFGKQR
ncbi:unnamed protein product [Tenebrio molitor]|nr:unnamed protein product [Tenebrio molitor]